MRTKILKIGFVFTLFILCFFSNSVSGMNDNIFSFLTVINQPPNIPSHPSPPNQTTGLYIMVDLFWIGGDPDGDSVTYDVYFGTTNPPKKVISNQSTLSYTPKPLAFNTKYYWKIIAWDTYNLSSQGPIWWFITMEAANNAPYKPSKPFGIINVNINLEYTYISGTYDPNDDDVFYLWDWGDGNTSGWLGPYDSGALCEGKHTWTTKNNCTVKVKAKDIYGKESEWSDPLPITVPYLYKNSILLFFELLFQRFFNPFRVPLHTCTL